MHQLNYTFALFWYGKQINKLHRHQPIQQQTAKLNLIALFAGMHSIIIEIISM